MEKLLTRKEAARLLGISIKTLDSARNNGLVSFVQYCENGSVYFTEHSLREQHTEIPETPCEGDILERNKSF